MDLELFQDLYQVFDVGCHSVLLSVVSSRDTASVSLKKNEKGQSKQKAGHQNVIV